MAGLTRIAADGLTIECAGLLVQIAADAEVAILARCATLRVAFLFARLAAEPILRIRSAIPEQIAGAALRSRPAAHDGAIGGARHIAGNIARIAIAATRLACAIAALETGVAATITTHLRRGAATGSGSITRAIAAGIPTRLVGRTAISPGGITWAAAARASTALLAGVATFAVAGDMAFLAAHVRRRHEGVLVLIAAAFRHAFVAAALLVQP